MWLLLLLLFRSSLPEVFLGNGILKICSKCTGEHLCRSMISIKSLCNFFEITLWHRCSPVYLLHIFRTPFPKNTYGRLLLAIITLFDGKASMIIYMLSNYYLWDLQLFLFFACLRVTQKALQLFFSLAFLVGVSETDWQKNFCRYFIIC